LTLARNAGDMRDRAEILRGVGEFSYDGSHELTQHLLNARMRKSTTGYLLAKDFPESPRKIDGAYALVLAWKARLDAVAKGLDKRPVERQVVTLG
jgi:phage terminase large subunit-like protein